jgi:glycosyltransferase involved in cell wall biosynthesis
VKDFLGEFGSITPEILIVGRHDDHTGLAEASLMIGRMFSSYLPFKWINIGEVRAPREVRKFLNSGKQVIFAEMPWHYQAIIRAILNKKSGKLSGLFVWDSDLIPPHFQEVLAKFDVVIVPTQYLADLISECTPETKVSTIPYALDLRAFTPLSMIKELGGNPNGISRIGTVAALHPRKNLDLLILAALDLWAEGFIFELHILAVHQQKSMLRNLTSLVTDTKYEKYLSVHTEFMTDQEYCNFIGSLDLYTSVSSGEGFNIPARQAIASGIATLLSDIPGHRDLINLEGVTPIPSRGKLPAVYPEFGNKIYGCQELISVADIAEGMRSALSQINRKNSPKLLELSQNWDYRSLEIAYRDSLFKPVSNRIKKKHRTLALIGHDAGFFAIFNTFISVQNTWLGDHGFDLIIPDWRVDRIKSFWKTEKFTSFCYGTSSDGNIYFRLFDTQNQFSLSEDELNERMKSALQAHSFNASADPNLTFVNADKLYRSNGFATWRKSMHSAMGGISPNINVRNRLHKSFENVNEDTYLIGMHVRHASHALEQPDKKIANSEDYIRISHELIDQEVSRNPGRDCKIFLASDQEKVVNRFKAEYGDALITIGDVTRVDVASTDVFESLDSGLQLKEGFQIQHLKASQESTWNLAMAEDVIADAWALARCHSLVHAVSNVATAVTFINPDIRCIPIYSGLNLESIERLEKIRTYTSLL